MFSSNMCYESYVCSFKFVRLMFINEWSHVIRQTCKWEKPGQLLRKGYTSSQTNIMMNLVVIRARVITTCTHIGRQTRSPPPCWQERVILRSNTTSNGLFLLKREFPITWATQCMGRNGGVWLPGGSGALRSYCHAMLPYSMPFLDAAEDQT